MAGEIRQREWKKKNQELISKCRRESRKVRDHCASRRAEALLFEHLTDEQIEEWKASKQFHVQTREGERVYRIKRGRAGNIVLVKDGDREAERLASFCIHEYHPDGSVPLEDNVLAQKLLLEADEDEFLRIANIS